MPHKFTTEESTKLNKNRVWTDEMRAKVAASVSAYAKEHPDSLETRVKKGASNKGKKFTEEHKRKIGEANRGKKHPHLAEVRYTGPRTLEMRQKQSLAWQRKPAELVLQQTQAGRNRVIEIYRNKIPTDIEKIVMSWLDDFGFSYEHNYQIGHYFVDLYVIARNIIFECDGEYWHSVPGRAAADKRIDSFLRNRGYCVIRLSELEIRSGRRDLVLTALV